MVIGTDTLITIEDADQQTLEQQQEPVYDVFLGGSCGNTCWRREIVIPYLKKRGISYYDPQRPAWSEHMIQEEQRAKENSRIFLFVLDPGTINATSFLEIAYFAARKASKLVVVFLGKHEWSDQALRVDLPDRIRTCNLLEAILKRHSVLMLTSIGQALDFVDEKIIGDKRWSEAVADPMQRLPFLKMKARRCAQRVRARCARAARVCRARLVTHGIRLALLLLFEALLVFGFDFILATSAVTTPISIWALVLPLIALNYLFLLAFIIYRRYKTYKRKRAKTLQCSLQLPMPPVPRVHALSQTHGAAAASSAAERRERAFGKSCQNSSASATSTASIGAGGYEPLIELFIGSRSDQFSAKAYGSTAGSQRRPELKRTNRVASIERLPKNNNGCLTSPVGYDVFLSCSSSSELDWITQKAVPELHKNGLSYTSALMCDNEMMRIPFLHTASHILYYIPSYKTFLSGMIEIAYFIGHADWQVTVCVPREAECLVLLDDAARLDAEIRRAVERRNECYRMAFSYLKDMAARRQVRVFTRVEDAVRHIKDATRRAGNGEPDPEDRSGNEPEPPHHQKRTALRQILERQHLVKERTSQNLLAHLREAQARGQHLQLDPAEIRPDGTCIDLQCGMAEKTAELGRDVNAER